MIYSAGDIEKYFSGQLTSAQMHDMEKASLDDPFLAEAMEGYESMNGKDWKDTLAAVRRQIAAAGSEAKVIPMNRSRSRWWKTAAAVLVIGSGTALTFILTKNKSGEKPAIQIAQTIIPAPDSNKITSPINAPVQAESTKTAFFQVKDKAFSGNGTIAQVNPQGRAADANATPGKQNVTLADSIKTNQMVLANAGNATPPLETKTITDALPSTNNPVQDNETVMEKRVPEKNNNNGAAFKKQSTPVQNKKEQQANYFFNAQVVAADNAPLPFTNITVKSENFGTYADVKGNFRLVSTDTTMNIEVRSVGYKPRAFLLKSNQPMNKIVLLEDEVALNEKTAVPNREVSLLKKSRRSRLLTDSVVNVEPADGWDNYNTYVANNINIPEETLKNEFHGEVELSFDVKSNGTISNIRIDKSLGSAYDEAARRLIEQGPQWKVIKGRRSKVSVKVTF